MALPERIRYKLRMPDAALPPKREVAETLLGKGSLFVHLDPRVAGVHVPQWLQQQPQLVLQVGLQMLIPIPDLRVNDDGVFGTLSFSRNPFACYVPWSAVFALVGDDGRGMVWPESMPTEIAAEVEREAVRAKRVQDEAEHPKSQYPRPRSIGSQPSAARLASVPNATPSEAPTVASLVGTGRRNGGHSQGNGSTKRVPAPAPRPTSPKRRELPPYLRVVK